MVFMSTPMPPELFELYSAARELCRPPPGLGAPDARQQQMVRLGVAVGVVEIRWRSEKVRHYLTLVDGLFALRTVAPLSQEEMKVEEPEGEAEAVPPEVETTKIDQHGIYPVDERTEHGCHPSCGTGAEVESNRRAASSLANR